MQFQLQPVPGETILVVIGRIREMRRIRPEVFPQTYRPDGRLGNRQVSQSPRCDYNKTVENNNPVPGRYSEKIADTEIDVLITSLSADNRCQPAAWFPFHDTYNADDCGH
ncbi:hypothetical protein ACET5Y_08020 [Aeromonas veronii]